MRDCIISSLEEDPLNSFITELDPVLPIEVDLLNSLQASLS